MKRLLVVGLCLCAVSGFSIFPLAVQPASVEVTTESAEIATDVVFINFPTSGAPVEVVETASDPSTDLITPSESTTDSTNLSNVEITTEEDLASKTLTVSPNDSTSQSKSETNSASASESTTSSTNVSDSASLSNSDLETTSEPKASNLLNSSSASVADALTSISPPNDHTSKTILNSAVDPTTPSTADNNKSSTDSPSSPDSTTESFIFVETTTEDLSFLSLDLLPPKTEYRSNEPDPRYDY